MAHPRSAPFFQLVVLSDIELPVAHESDYTNADKDDADEKPRPIYAPGTHELETVVENDSPYACQNYRPQQALAWWRADAFC